MKTFSRNGRAPLCVLPNSDESAWSDSDSWSDLWSNQLGTEQSARDLDIDEAINNEATPSTHPRARFVTLPGREPVDLEAVSDLWLD